MAGPQQPPAAPLPGAPAYHLRVRLPGRGGAAAARGGGGPRAAPSSAPPGSSARGGGGRRRLVLRRALHGLRPAGSPGRDMGDGPSHRASCFRRLTECFLSPSKCRRRVPALGAWGAHRAAGSARPRHGLCSPRGGRVLRPPLSLARLRAAGADALPSTRGPVPGGPWRGEGQPGPEPRVPEAKGRRFPGPLGLCPRP